MGVESLAVQTISCCLAHGAARLASIQAVAFGDPERMKWNLLDGDSSQANLSVHLRSIASVLPPGAWQPG
eukprot:1301669-Amphidinium_carterae.1